MADDQNPADDALDAEDDALDDLADLDFEDGADGAAGASDGAADADRGGAAAGPASDIDPDELALLIDDAPPPAARLVGTDLLASLAGDGLGRLTDFIGRLVDVLQVGLESVTGRGVTASGNHLEPVAYGVLGETYAGIAHVALRLQIAFSPEEHDTIVVLMPLADAGSLIRLETDPEELTDPDFRDRQLDAVAMAVRELLDLMSLALFTDVLIGAEVTLNGIRLDGAMEMLAGLATDSGEDEGLRLDAAFDVTDGEAVGLSLVITPSLIARFAQALAPAPAPARATAPPPRIDPLPQPTVSAPLAGEPASGRTFDAGNVSPIRPDATVRPADDVDVHPVRFPDIGEPAVTPRTPRSLELLMDVEMRVSVELGRSSMSVEEILSLGPGSVVELNKLAGEPVDILVNDHLIARGEVVVVDENFGVRVTEIVSAHKRAHAMAR